jgi:hypothetical protein
VDPITLWLIVGGVILDGLVAVSHRAATVRREKLVIPNAPIGVGW